jgi:hypothetical protein
MHDLDQHLRDHRPEIALEDGVVPVAGSRRWWCCLTSGEALEELERRDLHVLNADVAMPDKIFRLVHCNIGVVTLG